MAINPVRQWEHVSEQEEKEYRKLCLTYALDTNLFNKFRRSGLGNILESGDKIIGEHTIRGIKSRGKLSEFLATIDKAKLNDSIGLPFLHNFEDIHSCSSSTIQYLGDALEIKDLVKNHKINNIIEIGGGFGGLARILSIFIPFKSYTIIDFPEVLMLVSRFLENFPDIKSKVHLVSCFEVHTYKFKKNDLLIACSSFAELSPEMQTFYNNTIILNSTFSFIIYNTIHLKKSKNSIKCLIKIWRKHFLTEISAPYHSNLHFHLSPGFSSVNKIQDFFFGPLTLFSRISRYFKIRFYTLNYLREFLNF